MDKPTYVRDLFDTDFFNKWVPFLLTLELDTLYKDYVEVIEKTFSQSSEPIFLYHDILEEKITLGVNDYPLSFNHYKQIRGRGFDFSEILFEEIKLKEELQYTNGVLSKIYSQNHVQKLLHNVLLMQIKVLLVKKTTDEVFESQCFSSNLQTYRYQFWRRILEIIKQSLVLIRQKLICDTNTLLTFYSEYDVIFQSLKSEQLKKEIRERKTEYLIDKFIDNSFGNFKGWTQKDLDMIYELKNYYDFCLNIITKYRKFVKSNKNDLVIELVNDLQLEDISLFEYLSSENNQAEIISELPSATALSFIYNNSRKCVRDKYKNSKSLRNAFTELESNEKEKKIIEQVEAFEKRVKEFTDPRLSHSILDGLKHLKKVVPAERLEVFNDLQSGIQQNKPYKELLDIFDCLRSDTLFYSYSKKHSILKALRISFLHTSEQNISADFQKKNIITLLEKIKPLII